MNPFKFQITQLFGNPVARDRSGKVIIDYRKYGLKGHDGIDLIPVRGESWNITSLEDGIVVKDIDTDRPGLGKYATIWNPKTNRAWLYAHLNHNTVKINQKIKKGQKIGVMGNTGFGSGSHLHLALYKTDKNGYRINRNNGYKGAVNPLPYIKLLNKKQQNNMSKQVIFKDENDFNNWIKKWGIARLQELYKLNKQDYGYNIHQLYKAIDSAREKIKDLQNKTIIEPSECLEEKAKIINLQTQLSTTIEAKKLAENKLFDFNETLKEEAKNTAEALSQLKDKENKINDLEKEKLGIINHYENKIKKLKESQKVESLPIHVRDLYDTVRLTVVPVLAMATFNSQEILNSIQSGDYSTAINSVLASLATAVAAYLFSHSKNARKIKEENGGEEEKNQTKK